MHIQHGHQPLRILAISGSLRRVSSNIALVYAAAELAPDGVEVRVYRQLAALPPLSPELVVERSSPLPQVSRDRRTVHQIARLCVRRSSRSA
jgi:NAD(P)H-dependent FMN reductase